MMDQELDNHARRKRVADELVKGKYLATQLQTLLQNPTIDHIGTSNSLVPKLSLEIFRSFTDALFHINNCLDTPPPQLQGLSNSGDDRKYSEDSDWWRVENKAAQQPSTKSRRGCYKRRKTSEAWTIVSKTMEDGCSWRKYGQKHILNSEYPRCYFRCTHKHTQGCKATKQVQRVSENEYQTTYFGNHNCKEDPHYAPNQLQPEEEDNEHSSSYKYYHKEDESLTVSGSDDSSLLPEEMIQFNPQGANNLEYHSCFENLDNILRSDEMLLLNFLDN
ncbi:unnamed protein product [Cuscuta epithymum]|uniref:WRKY domain-containing protein n=1 Tax=Cuscuta epithymum TaxID=186058 RepID=A0AAV0D6C9_9ASTE|nr:unnamed protein product [Cuscuta epithymum]